MSVGRSAANYIIISCKLHNEINWLNIQLILTIMARNTPHQTILKMPSSHPLFYATEKNYFLQSLAQQAAIQSRLPTHDLQRNIRVDYYMGKYLLKKKEVEAEEREKKAKLNSSEFRSILEQTGERESERRKQLRERQMHSQHRQSLYEQFIQQGNIYVQAEHDYDYDTVKEQGIKRSCPQTILALDDPLRRKQLYLLDLEISKIRSEQDLPRKIAQSHQMCKNNELLSKLSSSLISSYMVYFDQIYNQLIDQILEEEVLYLNKLEAEYRLEGKINRNSPQAEDVRTLKMIELVKQLDQLAD